MPDLSSIVISIRAGNTEIRAAQQRVIDFVLAQQQGKLLADRYAYHFIDEATKSTPHVEETIIAIMAWAMACATTESLARRVDKYLNQPLDLTFDDDDTDEQEETY